MELQLMTGKVLLNDIDWEIIKDYNWYLNPNGYAVTFLTKKKQNKKQSTYILFLHRLLMNPKKGECVDHINGNKLDNRRENLRICTRSENSANKAGRRNGHKGVYKRKNTNGNFVYLAGISFNNKRKHLGTFNTEEEAAAAYNRAAKELHGNFAYLNNVPDIKPTEHFASIKTQSPFFGVKKRFSKRKQCFIYYSIFSQGKKQYHLGVFSSEKEAAEAYNKAAIKYNGRNRNQIG